MVSGLFSAQKFAVGWLALKFSVVPSSSSLCLGSSVGLVYSIATDRYGEVSLLSAWLITKEEGD